MTPVQSCPGVKQTSGSAAMAHPGRREQRQDDQQANREKADAHAAAWLPVRLDRRQLIAAREAFRVPSGHLGVWSSKASLNQGSPMARAAASRL